MAVILLVACASCGHVTWTKDETIATIGISIDILGLGVEYAEHFLGGDGGPPPMRPDGGIIEAPPPVPVAMLLACAPAAELGTGVVRCVTVPVPAVDAGVLTRDGG